MKKALHILIIIFILLGMFTACSNDVRTGIDIKGGTSTISKKIEATTVPEGSSKPANGQLKVHFIDVGQADSILVQVQGGRTMLVDAGNNGDGNLVVNYLKSQGVTNIDILIGSHPHEDHIGGLDTVINGLGVGSIYMPKVNNTTKTFEDVLTAVKNKGLKVTTAAAGVQLDMGPGVKAEIFAPNGDKYEDLNDWSAVIKLTYGNTSFLLTGDAEAGSEKEMLGKGYNLKADVLKVGHHGSASSTSVDFLTKVNPKYAVISVGKDNDYGHPHKPTMQNLQARGIPVYRTDQNGTIVATSDGNSIKFNVNPGDYSFNGEGSGATQSSSGTTVQQQPANNPTPVPQPTQKPAQNNIKTVFYTPSGKSYHYDQNCKTLTKSKTILSGLLHDVINSGHADPCDVCTY